MTEPTIICPSCKTEIKLTESLAAPLIESTRRQYEQQEDVRIRRREAEVRQPKAAITEARSSRLGLESDKTFDRRRCEDSEVKRFLAPLLPHGKYQPGMNKKEMLTADSKAISLSRLCSCGALEPGPTGIQKLRNVATNKPLQRPIDTIRTRWGYKARLRDTSRSTKSRGPSSSSSNSGRRSWNREC